jgi:hypothetical protein
MSQQADLAGAVTVLKELTGGRAEIAIADIETKLMGADKKRAITVVTECGSSPQRLDGVLELKSIASPGDAYIHGPADVYVHAHAVILALPSLLEPGEVVVASSLGAGSTGRCCDLVTNRRLAKFKLARREDQSTESRQFHLLVAVFSLAEDPSPVQRRELYVLDASRPRQFLTTSPRLVGEILTPRAVASAEWLRDAYEDNKGRTVAAYWANLKGRVALRNISEVAPKLGRVLTRLPIDDGSGPPGDA